jgi:hypothetical protein
MRVRSCKIVVGIVLEQQCQSLKMQKRTEEKGNVNVAGEKRWEI